jgi:hypothetical protein
MAKKSVERTRNYCTTADRPVLLRPFMRAGAFAATRCDENYRDPMFCYASFHDGRTIRQSVEKPAQSEFVVPTCRYVA